MATASPDHLTLARQVISAEQAALELVKQRLDESFVRLVERLDGCVAEGGAVIVTGMGKAGHVAAKLVATLASTGTRAHQLHPAEAVHGDLGRIGKSDILLALSYSGETEEILRLMQPVRDIGVSIAAITSRGDSALGRMADITVVLGPLSEACPLGLAPSASTTAMMALGDAVAFALSSKRSFKPEQFARFHPAGSLGRLTRPVDELMRRGDQLRVAHYQLSIRQALVRTHKQGRRTGVMLLVDDDSVLRGIYTDGDLARLLERRRDEALDHPVATVMNNSPTTVPAGTMVRDALTLLSGGKFSQLPVLDAQHRPIGVLDITDLIGLVPDLHEDSLDQSPESRAAA